MNVNKTNIENLSYDRDSGSDLVCEDDGFFSDVPTFGSLSRSQLALNKFMKKNLLYEENEYEKDGAYFSKESTPNESVTKYDSDSAKSNESTEKVKAIRTVRIRETHIGDARNLPATRNSNIPVRETHIEYNSDLTTPTTEPLTEIPNEQTDDYKYKQLRDNSNNNSPKKSVVRIEYSDIRNEPTTLQVDHRSVSLDDLTNDYGTAIDDEDNSHTNRVEMREKPSVKREENRHTIHDISDWVNRTNTYPDVYAPLPYKSPRRYVESDVNIHYRCPVRHDPLPLVPEKELARQQAEHMKRLYREQRRNKYLQELQDMQNRRHQDNFTPSQKNILPLNRYDEAERVVAKALYTFNGQTTRELSFRKGEIIHVRRQIDSNWYEGEVHGRIGLFPYNYVEIQKGDKSQAPKKPVVVEGRARAKFDFIAQTNLELPLKKGEVVVLTRRIDQNWWEGRNGSKTGIFPDSYVTILQEPSQNKPESQAPYNPDKPVASPAAHGMMNGTAKRSMGAHSYMPQQNSQALSNAPPATQPLPGYAARQTPAATAAERGYGPPAGTDLNNTEPLYVDTNAEAVPYRAMYKYRPQNPDELELSEGDTVYVLEKCDDGWYVGSSQRTGRFGTFPGNYVERI